MDEIRVAPRAGAWIETLGIYLYSCREFVAPRAGAWIETTEADMLRGEAPKSRPVRARGLKREGMELRQRNRPVAPRAGAWIVPTFS